MRPRLAIVGSHPDTRENAPFNDETYDIWVLNEAPQSDWCKRWDVAFQMHIPEVYMSPNNYSNKTHWEWLQKEHRGKVIYMQEYDELVPNSRGYPLEAIKETLPGARLHLENEDVTWMDSSPVYALVLALYLGYRVIDVWGVELSSNTEYYRQLPNWCYWVGVAEGMGVDLTLHSGQVHYKSPLYGYQGEVQLKKAFFKSRLDLMEANFKAADNELRKLKDRLNSAMVDLEFKKVGEYILSMRDCAIQAGTLSGALGEAQKCYERPDPTPRQEMEKRAAQAQRDGDEKKNTMFHASGKTEYVWNVWRTTGKIEALNLLREYVREAMQAAFDMGVLAGIYKENLEYMAELDKLTDAAGGEKTLAALGVANGNGN